MSHPSSAKPRRSIECPPDESSLESSSRQHITSPPHSPITFENHSAAFEWRSQAHHQRQRPTAARSKWPQTRALYCPCSYQVRTGRTLSGDTNAEDARRLAARKVIE